MVVWKRDGSLVGSSLYISGYGGFVDGLSNILWKPKRELGWVLSIPLNMVVLSMLCWWFSATERGVGWILCTPGYAGFLDGLLMVLCNWKGSWFGSPSLLLETVDVPKFWIIYFCCVPSSLHTHKWENSFRKFLESDKEMQWSVWVCIVYNIYS